MKLKFKKNITVTFACGATELLLCPFPASVVCCLVDVYDEITTDDAILKYLLLILALNLLFVLISLIASAFIKTTYIIEGNQLIVRSKNTDDKSINLQNISAINYDFGSFVYTGSAIDTRILASEIVLLDKDNNILFALSNPPIVMVHYLKKKCKMAKVTYKHTNRFWLFAVLSGIFAIIALFSGS